MRAREAIVAAVMAAALIAPPGCASEQSIAASLSNAAHPPRLPEVFACWEKEFEASGFQGEYVAVIDVRIDAASKLHDAKVRSLEARGGTGRDPAPFKACLEEALNHASLPPEDDKDGPGFHVSFGVDLVSLRVAFTDSPTRKRAAAGGPQGNVLVGPRADRCQGLYSHAPPRDAGTIYDEIAQADARSKEYGSDPDRRARELQKKYDAELELGDRLKADLDAPGLPEANKARLKKALAETTESAKKTGGRIGCKR